MNLKLLCPGQYLEFQPQRHWRINWTWLFQDHAYINKSVWLYSFNWGQSYAIIVSSFGQKMVSFKNTGILLNILMRVDRAGYCWDFTAFKLTFLRMRHFYFCNINFTINIYLNVHIISFVVSWLSLFPQPKTYPGQSLSFPMTFNTKLEGRSAACATIAKKKKCKFTTKPIKRK